MKHIIDDNKRAGHPRIYMMAPVTTPPENGVLVEEEGNFPPDFIRLPATGERCRFTDLNRSYFNKLILGKKPRVRSVLLRDDDSKRGIRLVHLPSLLDFLYQEMERQQNDQEEGGPVVDE